MLKPFDEIEQEARASYKKSHDDQWERFHLFFVGWLKSIWEREYEQQQLNDGKCRKAKEEKG